METKPKSNIKACGLSSRYPKLLIQFLILFETIQSSFSYPEIPIRSNLTPQKGQNFICSTTGLGLFSK